MQPESVGVHIGSAAVVSTLFFVFFFWSSANFAFTKFKPFLMLALSSALRGTAYALSAADLARSSRDKYVAYRSLESIGYGFSIAVLLLVTSLWVQSPKEPRPQRPKLLALLNRSLLLPTLTFNVIIAPIGFTQSYRTDNLAANRVGRKLQLVSFWGRAGILAAWAVLITYQAGWACCSYIRDRRRLPRGSVSAGQSCVKNPVPPRSLSGIQRVDSRLLVNLIVLCTFFEIIALAFQTVALYHTYFERDTYYLPLVILPEYLELLVLNIPGFLPRLAQSSTAQPKSSDQV